PYTNLRDLPSFPTRRSSDLRNDGVETRRLQGRARRVHHGVADAFMMSCRPGDGDHRHREINPEDARSSTGECSGEPSRAAAQIEDRKSTRLNSSHVAISYAV